MSFLEEIQAAAADDSVSLSAVLRKCQILATRLRYQPFKDWVESESNGYPAGSVLPDYRMMRGVPSKADFIGVTHKLSNYPVPGNLIPDMELQTLIATMPMWGGVGEYEAMLKQLGRQVGGALKNPWPVGMGRQLLQMQGMQCIEAWQELPASAIAGMLSQIRNRVLTFTLEIEEANPDLGKASAPPTPKEQERVATVYQTVILGGTPTIVHGGNVRQQINVAQGDLTSLVLALRDLGVPQQEISSLTRAIDADRSAGATFGDRTHSWLASASKKIAGGAWKLAVASAPDLIVAAVKNYFGLP